MIAIATTAASIESRFHVAKYILVSPSLSKLVFPLYALCCAAKPDIM